MALRTDAGEAASSLLSFAHIKVLVVPVHPIRRDTFQKYLHLLSQFNCVSLDDLTPPDAKAAKLTENVYHGGFLHYKFATTHNREHAPFEEIQLNRQVLGVIGIMHCQQTPSLADGIRRFQQIVQRYPSALAFRCFAFEPSDGQADNTRGVIMIPNVGDISFYMQTMINDFTSDLLLALGSLAGQIERRTMVSSPNMSSPAIQAAAAGGTIASAASSGSASAAASIGSAAASGASNIANSGSSNQNAPISSGANASAPSSANSAAQQTFTAPTLPPSAHISSPLHGASTPIDRAISVNNALTADTPVAPSPYIYGTSPSAAPIVHVSPSTANMPQPQTSTHGFAPSTNPTPSIAAAGFGTSAISLAGLGIPNMVNPDKTRKRTPARIQKMLGDLYLMVGRLDLAVASYFAAIEGARNNSDHQWQASALESLCCAQLLNHIMAVGLGPSRLGEGPSISSSSDSNRDKSAHRGRRSSLSVVGGLPSTRTILSTAMRSQTAKELRAFLIDLPERYREIVSLYDRAHIPGSNAFYPILQINTSLRMASFLAEVHNDRCMLMFSGGAAIVYWATEPKGIGAELAARIGTTGTGASASSRENAGAGGGSGGASSGNAGGGAPSGTPTMTQGDRILLQNGQGASRVDVISWIMRAWHAGIDYLTLTDQLISCATMTAICGQIACHRKHSFFLHRTALVGHALMIRDATTSMGSGTSPSVTNAPYASDTATSSQVIRNHRLAYMRTTGPLDCLERSCDLLGVYSDGVPLLDRAHQHVSSDVHIHDENRTKNGAISYLSTSTHDEDDIWLDEYENEDDLDWVMAPGTVSGATSQSIGPSQEQWMRRVVIPRIRGGWPALQIGVLKDCVDVAQVQGDHVRTVWYISHLLRRLYRDLSRRDQIKLSETLQQVVLHRQARSASVDDVHKITSDAQDVDGSSKRDESSEAVGYEADETEKDGQVSMRSSSESISRAPIVRGTSGSVLGAPVLRRLQPIRQPTRQVPTPRPRQILGGGNSQETKAKDVFIYNPFAKRDEKAGGKQRQKHPDVILVADETIHVDVTLANPFAFDLDIQSLALSTSGVRFRPVAISTVIPSETRMHTVRLSGTCLESGTLKIHGIVVRMLGGCIEEEILPVRHTLEDPKKRTKDGRRPRQDERERFGKKNLEFLGKASAGKSKQADAQVSQASAGIKWSLPLKVIPPQPALRIVRTSLGAHRALMLFEGERTSFHVTVQNIGTVPVDYLHISIIENMSGSGTMPISTLTPTRKLGFLEPYERDIHDRSIRAFWLVPIGSKIESDKDAPHKVSDLAKKNAFRPTQSVLSSIARVGDARGETVPMSLAPGETLKLEFGVFGKPECIGAVIQFDSSFLGGDGSEGSNDAFFYTRQVTLPVLLTIHAALTIHNIDFLLQSHNEQTFMHASTPATPLPHTKQAKQESRRVDMSLGDLTVDPRLSDAVMDAVPDEDQVRSTFLFTFDVHNAWNEPFHMRFDAYEDDGQETPTSTYHAVIHSNVSKRIILPLKRLRLPKTVVEQSIPVPEWKQYVVDKSAEAASGEEEALRRAVFWCREVVVGGLGHRGRIVARWMCSKDRFGVLAMRGFAFTERMLHALKIDSIGISASVVSADLSETDAVVRVRPDYFQCRVRAFVRLEWRIVNFKDDPVHLYVRVVPVQEDSHGVADIDMNDKLVWAGALSAVVPQLAAGASTTHSLLVRFESLARIKFLCHVEEIVRPPPRLMPHAAPPEAPKKPKKGAAAIVLGNIEKVHWDRDGLVIQAFE